jgi:N-acetylglucosamine-6-sulfatase
LYDLQEDPLETNNLIFSQKHLGVIKEMNEKLFDLLEGTGGMSIPLYRDRGGQNSLRNPDGAKPADFPPEMVRKPGR